MKENLSDDDLEEIDRIKDTIKKKDIRTHSQLKAEAKKLGLTMSIKKYKEKFDDLIKANRDKAIEKGKGKEYLQKKESLELQAIVGIAEVANQGIDVQKSIGSGGEEEEEEQGGETKSSPKSKGGYSR